MTDVHATSPACAPPVRCRLLAPIGKSSVASDALSAALSAVLDRSLLQPLLQMIAGCARAVDWTRATVETLPLPAQNPAGVLIDRTRRRVLWTEYSDGRVKAIPLDDLTAAAQSVGAAKSAAGVVTLAAPLADAPVDAHWLRRPSSIAIEPVTQWPAGRDALSRWHVQWSLRLQSDLHRVGHRP
jgi:hypothetical protein